jgi:hypothetical protein
MPTLPLAGLEKAGFAHQREGSVGILPSAAADVH